MRKTIFAVMLVTLSLGVMPATASAVVVGSWVDPRYVTIAPASHVSANISRLEGLLHAYSVNKGNGKVKEQVLAASDDLSASLETLNVAIEQNFPTLNEEEQIALIESYSSLGLRLEELVVEANSVFGKTAFEIRDGGEITGDVDYGIPGLVWDISRGLDW